MTENKRFECDKGSRIIIDNETKLHYIMTLDWECSLVTKLLNRFADENEQLKADVKYFNETYSVQEYGLDIETHVQLSSPILSRKELLKENEQLKKENNILKASNGEYEDALARLEEENEQLKASLYAEKTNTAEVVNDYSKQFKRHSAQFSFMMDLADDLGVDVTTLEALDD